MLSVPQIKIQQVCVCVLRIANVGVPRLNKQEARKKTTTDWQIVLAFILCLSWKSIKLNMFFFGKQTNKHEVAHLFTKWLCRSEFYCMCVCVCFFSVWGYSIEWLCFFVVAVVGTHELGEGEFPFYLDYSLRLSIDWLCQRREFCLFFSPLVRCFFSIPWRILSNLNTIHPFSK